MIEILEDMDDILKTGSKYLLGKWISDARSWGLTETVYLFFFVSSMIIYSYHGLILSQKSLFIIWIIWVILLQLDESW